MQRCAQMVKNTSLDRLVHLHVEKRITNVILLEFACSKDITLAYVHSIQTMFPEEQHGTAHQTEMPTTRLTTYCHRKDSRHEQESLNENIFGSCLRH